MPEKNSTPVPLLKIRRAGDLVEVIPYLLGFHPRESLVLVGLSDGRVTVTARMDLAALGDVSEQPLVATELLRVLTNSGSVAAVAAVYTATGPRIDDTLVLRDVVEALGAATKARGVDLLDAILVCGDRYFGYLCQDPDCCPPDGHALAAGSSSAAATATYAGLVALPERDDLARLLEPDPDPWRAELEPRIAAEENATADALLRGHEQRHRRSVKRAIFAAARAADVALFAASEPVTDDAVICRLAVGLTDIATRDALWLAIEGRRLDGSTLWRDIARRVPAPYDAPALFLYGWAQWREGNGTLARLAAERALRSDPEYSAAALLTGALDTCLDPRSTPRLTSRSAAAVLSPAESEDRSGRARSA